MILSPALQGVRHLCLGILNQSEISFFQTLLLATGDKSSYGRVQSIHENGATRYSIVHISTSVKSLI